MKPIVVKDFRTYRRDRFIDAQTAPSVRLAPTLLLANEMGVDSGFPEEISETNWAKVEFRIPSAKVKSAELLFYVNTDKTTQTRPMRILVNGHPITHRQKEEKMLTGGWDRHRIPARLLKEGKNEFVFSRSGLLHVDPFPPGLEKPPASRSRRSFDGGKTWHEGAHGPDRDAAGGYLVRLRLKGYAPSGRLLSPVVDLADPDGSRRIAPAVRIDAVRLVPRQQIPEGTSIRFEMRTGDTPSFDPCTWTPWQEGTTLSHPARFVQWRAILSTSSADRTPVLRGVALHADLKEKRPPEGKAALVEADQPELEYSSYRFSYLKPHPRVDRLRKQYRLDEVIAAGRTELEQLALLRDWVHSQWLGWQSDKYPDCPSWEPLEILEVRKGNWGYGMCTHYAATFAACAAALGFVSRVLIVDHHCLTEVWSEELQKWILEDPGPCREFDATYELDGIPLNALELHEAVARGETKRLKARQLPQKTVKPMKTNVAEIFRRFGIPLRNDHLIHPEPAELRHGATQYHWNGYLWWSDRIDPKYPEYSLQTSRPADFYWSVNQTRIYLRTGEKDGSLRVDLAHTTPNFSHFLVQIDGDAWKEQRASTFSWILHPGENRLAVRSVNLFGRRGRIARVRVRYEE